MATLNQLKKELFDKESRLSEARLIQERRKKKKAELEATLRAEQAELLAKKEATDRLWRQEYATRLPPVTDFITDVGPPSRPGDVGQSEAALLDSLIAEQVALDEKPPFKSSLTFLDEDVTDVKTDGPFSLVSKVTTPSFTKNWWDAEEAVGAPTGVRTIDELVPDNTQNIINEIEESRSRRRRRLNVTRALLGLPPTTMSFKGSGLTHAQLLAQMQNKRDVAIGMAILQAGPMDEDKFRGFLSERGIYDPDEVKKADTMRKSLLKDWGREKQRLDVAKMVDAGKRDQGVGLAVMLLPETASEQDLLDTLFASGLTRASDQKAAADLYAQYWPEIKFTTFYKKDPKTGEQSEVRVPNKFQGMMRKYIGDTSYTSQKTERKYGSKRIALPVLEGMDEDKKAAVLAAAERLGIANPERIGAFGTVSLDSDEDLRDMGVIFDAGGAAMGEKDDWAEIRDLNDVLIGQINLAHTPSAEYYRKKLSESGSRGVIQTGAVAAARAGNTTQYTSSKGRDAAIQQYHQAKQVGAMSDQVLNIMKPKSEGGLGRPDWVGTAGWLKRWIYETKAIGQNLAQFFPGLEVQKKYIDELRADLEGGRAKYGEDEYKEIEAEINALEDGWFELKEQNIPEGLLTAEILEMGIGVLLARMLNPKDRLLKDYFTESRKMAEVQGPFVSAEMVYARMSWISRASQRYMADAQAQIATQPPATYEIGPEGRILPVENLQQIQEASTISDVVQPAVQTTTEQAQPSGQFRIRIYADGRRVKVYSDGTEVDY